MPPSDQHAETDTLPLILRVGGSWYWEQDAAFRFADVSANVEEPNRMPRELIGKTRWEMSDLMPPDFWQAHQRVLEAHLPFHNLEYAVPYSASQRLPARWICSSGEPRFDQNGGFIGYRGLSNDVTVQRRARLAAQTMEDRFGDFVGSLSDCLWETDASLHFTWVSRSLVEAAYTHPISSLGMHLTRLHHLPETDAQAAQQVDQAIAQRKAFRDFVYCIKGDKGQMWVSKSGTPYFDADGEFAGYRGSNRDVTDRIRAEQNLQARERRLTTLFEQSPIPTLECDTQLRVKAWNAAAERLFGWTAPEMQDQEVQCLFEHLDQRGLKAVFQQKILQATQHQAMVRNISKDGRPLYCRWTNAVLQDENNRALGVVSMIEDCTDRDSAEQKASHMASHDLLTGLHNRQYLNERIKDALDHANKGQVSGAVLLINLDRFKLVNDSMGHTVGDYILHAAAQRIQQIGPADMVAARLGADEFALLLPQVSSTEAVWKLCESLQSALRKPYESNLRLIECTARIGVALFPEDGNTPIALMQAADIAIDYAKSRGPDSVRGVTASLRMLANARRNLALDLQYAVRNNELLLHYQPQVEASTGRICGVEALVRWAHPGMGMVPPDQFIPIAEETGAILEIGDWVLNEACRVISEWRSAGLTDITMSVNLSALQLRHASIVPDLAQLIRSFDLPGHVLELELTESVAMTDPQTTISTLQAVRTLGVQMAIDDFGTGYSSLGYLKLLPMNRLKLDRSFVKDIQTDAKDAAICSSTIALAHTLGLTVVAEGVETESQRDQLRGLGCDIFQGYLFSKPLGTAQAFDFLQKKCVAQQVLHALDRPCALAQLGNV